MPAIPESFHDLFERKTFAHVATVTPEGYPHVTPVWVDYDAETDRLLVNTERGRRKERNVAREPKVGVSMLDPDDPYRYCSVTGEVVATTEEGAREHIDHLSRRYFGRDYDNPIRTRRVLLEIEPEEVITSG
jgi:PPOX class probable F420-dependent enzyme